jgi:ElaA protein
VVTAQEVRQHGFGRELMARAVAETRARYPGQAICIAAQAYLERFYGGFGFVATGRPYDEDGILHVDMIAPPSP